MEQSDRIQQLADDILHCQKCDLFKTRTNPVIGEGSLDADLLFIGEAPGYNEDQQGRPFVGRAGSILDELIESIGLKRSEVYIANILKCRPPKNRNPTSSEIKACTPHLEKQLDLIDPTVILPMGSFSTEYVFDKFNIPFTKISKLHGKIISKNTLYNQLHILPLYHPAVATYNPNKKTVLLEDIKQVKPFILRKSV
ncbi:MAG: uracil-DNA glycosylase [Candidatus Thermoplasmatota archaeon]|nr:uracil-DNA glycosylase [Candidatus Thermoplasmatota archaeon]